MLCGMGLAKHLFVSAYGEGVTSGKPAASLASSVLGGLDTPNGQPESMTSIPLNA